MLALALVLLLWYKKKILLLPAAALGIGALFLLPESLQARFLSMLDFSNASASGRFVLWSECLAVWKDHWLLGIGLGPENFSAAYAPYATGLLDFQPPHSNMLYLEMFLSTGIVGGLLFCGFFFGIFVRLRRAVRARPEKRDPLGSPGSHRRARRSRARRHSGVYLVLPAHSLFLVRPLRHGARRFGRQLNKSIPPAQPVVLLEQAA